MGVLKTLDLIDNKPKTDSNINFEYRIKYSLKYRFTGEIIHKTKKGKDLKKLINNILKDYDSGNYELIVDSAERIMQ